MENLINNSVVPAWLNNSGHDSLAGKNNWCFIDAQNLQKGIQERKWKLDFKAFRHYLMEHHSVQKAIFFLGRMPENTWLYLLLENCGFELVFRDVKRKPNGTIVCNVDTDIVFCAMKAIHQFDAAILVADDSDYCRMLKDFLQEGKLQLVISPHTIQKTSKEIKKTIPSQCLMSIDDIKTLVEYKKNRDTDIN